MALAAERVDELADALAQRLGADPGEVRSVVSEVLEGWRREAERLGEHASAAPRRVAAEVGLASEDALAELELRVARVEHRLKLLEGE
jgi:polyhydroxyalkanoate synthesis regulator phasin